jgi:peptidoglycan/xylan/chitin deacetylase (PgdA/CDA1 family)
MESVRTLLLLLAGTSAAPPDAGLSVSPDIVTHGPAEGRRVALTFDACSTGGKSRYDRGVIQALREAKVPATLFISGHWAESHPDETKELAKDLLFELGNHSYVHPHMTRVSEARQRKELEHTQEILTSLTGETPRFFRPPYGEVNAALARVAASEGLRTIQFDVASGDPDKSFTKVRLTKWVLHEVKPGSIVVMHMNGNGWHTAEALPDIIKGLRERGFVLSKVSELTAE